MTPTIALSLLTVFGALVGFLVYMARELGKAAAETKQDAEQRKHANQRTDEVKRAKDVEKTVYSLPDGAASDKLLSKWRRD